jgi:hypothetical protein
MKKSKLLELHGILDAIAVLQHFIDSEAGSLFIGMAGVENQVVINKELDMKVRILLAVQVEKMEEELRKAGVDMTPEEPTQETSPEAPSEEPSKKVIDATASEPGETGAGATGSGEASGADEESSPE